MAYHLPRFNSLGTRKEGCGCAGGCGLLRLLVPTVSAPQAPTSTFRALCRPSEIARTMMPSLEFSALCSTEGASVIAWSMNMFGHRFPGSQEAHREPRLGMVLGINVASFLFQPHSQFSFTVVCNLSGKAKDTGDQVRKALIGRCSAGGLGSFMSWYK